MNDTDTLRDTIIPKSDQLNYDDLIAGPITVRITAVKRGTAEQPVSIEIEGHQPYKPCKGMRRVLIAAWGEKGSAWVGRSMTLFGEPSVKYGGVAVGGIQVSHLSDIHAAVTIKLTVSRGKRVDFTVQPLKAKADKQSRADACRAFLCDYERTEADAVALIGKPLEEATLADFKLIAEWAQTTDAAEALPFE